MPPDPAPTGLGVGLGLAEPYGPGRPGLPRGRSSLPGQAVRRAQRERLLRAVISAIAEKGYAHTTVADVVARARVSRRAFYDHFTDLPECFFAAVTAAQEEIFAHLSARIAGPGGGTPRAAHGGASAAATSPADASPAGTLRRSVHAYLTLCAQEPEFARCVLVELPAAGPAALAGRNAAYRWIAGLLRLWRERAHGGALPPVPDECYLAAVGAVGELVLAHVGDGTTSRLPGLTDTVVGVILRILAVPFPVPDPVAGDVGTG
jgi:AcrR family transcriptional regulator